MTHKHSTTRYSPPPPHDHDHQSVSSGNTWWTYVNEISGHASTSVIAAHIGVAQSSVTRWRNTSPSVAAVRAFARSYDRPVLEAFAAAQFLDAADIAGTISAEHSAELQTRARELTEIAARLQELANMITSEPETDQ